MWRKALSSIFKKNNPEAMRPVRFLRMLYSANNVPFYQNKNKAEGPDDLDASSDHAGARLRGGRARMPFRHCVAFAYNRKNS
jgi:hypothetical protein